MSDQRNLAPGFATHLWHRPFYCLPLYFLVICLVSLLAMVTLTQRAYAADIAVDLAADAVTLDGNCTLREAINAANSDTTVDNCPAGDGIDTILLPADTYLLTLLGANEDANASGDLDITETLIIHGAGEGLTILDGNSTDRILHTLPAVDLTLRNLTLQNGVSDSCGGALCASNNVTFTAVTADSNTTTDDGAAGGAASIDGDAMINASTLQNNITVADNAPGGALFVFGNASINGSTFASNLTLGSTASGGALYIIGNPTIEQSTFQNNATLGDFSSGGAIYSAGDMTTSASTFRNNTTSSLFANGGAIFNFGTTTITDSAFENNFTLSDGAAGGAIYSFGTTLISGTTFLNNLTAGIGSHGGALYGQGDSTIKDSSFQGNYTTGDLANGGAAAIEGRTQISTTRFLINQTLGLDANGGALYLVGSRGDSQVVNTLFASNQTSTHGAALYVEGLDPASTLALLHTTIANIFNSSVDESAIYVQASTVGITNTIISSYTVAISQIGGTVTEDSNLFFGTIDDTLGVITSSGNSVTGDPQFIDPSLDDYRLGDGSPAIDLGLDAGVAEDFFGAVRPQGPGFDAGYYEAAAHTLVAGDDSYSTPKNSVLNVNAANGVLSNDLDSYGHTLVASVQTGVANGVLMLNADGSFVYTPAANYVGSDSFTYLVSDGGVSDGGVSDVGTVTLTITPVNDPPTATGTPTKTPTKTLTKTPTKTPTPTVTPTATTTKPPTPTLIATATVPATATPTATVIATATVPPVVSKPIWLSTNKNGNVAGLTYRDEDIIAYDRTTGQWRMIFDGSDVGLASNDLDDFELLPNGHLLLSVERDFVLRDFGPVDDADLLEFIPTSLGNQTSGTFSLYLAGAPVGLEKHDHKEDIKALALDTLGQWVISVRERFDALGIQGSDKDLFTFSATSLGANASGTWEKTFQGAAIGLTSKAEDLRGLWIDPQTDALYLTINGTFTVTGSNGTFSGNGNDILICHPLGLGPNMNCAFESFWHFAELADQIIDGLAILDPAQLATLPPIQNTIANSVDPDEWVGDDAQEASDDAPPILQLGVSTFPHTDTPIAAGDRISYTITLSNTENWAESVVVTASLSPNLQFDANTITPPLTTTTSAAQSAQAPLIWTIPSLPSGEHFQGQFTVVVNATANATTIIGVSADGTPIQTTQLHHVARVPDDTGGTDSMLNQKVYLPIVPQ